MFAFDTQSLLRNVPYKMFHTKEITALPRRWKKMPTAIGLSVCKIHIIFFCDGATKLCDGVTVVEVSRSHTPLDTDTLGTTPQTSDQLGSNSTKNIHKRRKSMHILENETTKPGTKPLQNYTSHRTARCFEVTT